ncbi:DUF1573 domain-containing protein [Bacteroidia bacterium]|nr:DUF1573 domain-containing protein [Bacteroidia bacterium]
MKSVFYLALGLLFLVACQGGPKENKGLDASVIETDNSNVKEPKMTFNKSTHDFGTITESERVEHTFKFKNEGDADLIISSCTASCGCTIPNWPKEPIAPGESGVIKVEFNSAGKSDMVSKDITILSNTNPVKTMLQIKVFVEKKDQ